MVKANLSVKCLKGNEMRRPSHGDAAVELVDLVLKVFFQLRSLCL